MVQYLGSEISTSSFAMYTSSFAVLLQALVLICFSSFADYGMLLSIDYNRSASQTDKLSRPIPQENAHVYLLRRITRQLSFHLHLAITILPGPSSSHHRRHKSRLFLCFDECLLAITSRQPPRQQHSSETVFERRRHGRRTRKPQPS